MDHRKDFDFLWGQKIVIGNDGNLLVTVYNLYDRRQVLCKKP